MLKIGDRIVLKKQLIHVEPGITGTIVDECDGDWLVKLDEDVGSFRMSLLSDYISDKRDLLWVVERFVDKI